jgi:hypothetical protein
MRTLEWKLRMLTDFSSTTQVDGRSQFEGKSTYPALGHLRFEPLRGSQSALGLCVRNE